LCDRCQRNASQLTAAAVDLQPIKVQPEVWYLVGMDLIGPYNESFCGNKYVLTVTDYFSKYVEAIPLKDKSAVSVAKCIYKVYCRHGAPVSLICDQGKEFINHVSNSQIITCSYVDLLELSNVYNIAYSQCSGSVSLM
jgi:hypothetical protein